MIYFFQNEMHAIKKEIYQTSSHIASMVMQANIIVNPH